MKLVVKTLIIFGFTAALSACLPTEEEKRQQNNREAVEGAVSAD